MKILIRLPNWLGDVVMSTAFITAVRELYPTATIDAIIKAELAELAMFIPELNTIHLFSKQKHNGPGGVYRFGRSLRSEKYDVFFNLPSSLSSAVLSWATGAAKRIGFGKEGGFFLLTHSYKKPSKVHRVDEYISLLEQFTGQEIQKRKVKLSINRSAIPDKARVLINFNSEAESRRMPIDKGRSIINCLTKSFTTQKFVLIGSAKEFAFVEHLIEGVDDNDRVENLVGKTDLANLAELMAESAALLTTDSGPAHLANSVGMPTLVLFGAGNEQNTAPYNKRNLTVIRYGKLDCEPCMRNSCKLYNLPKCLELIDNLNITISMKSILR